MTTTLFGVPEIYQDALSQKRPVLLALPWGLACRSLFTAMKVAVASISGIFATAEQQPDGLHIAF